MTRIQLRPDTMPEIKFEIYRAVIIKHSLLFYAKTKMKVNSAYTPTNMLNAAHQITGKKFKRGQYVEAATAIDEWLKTQKDETP